MICPQVVEIFLDRLVEDDIRHGRDANALRGLAQSLAEVGQLAPIRVRPEGDRYAIVDGHRRATALKELGRTTVLAMVVEHPLDEAQSLQQALISNTQREGLSPVDLAEAISRLMEVSGWNASETARHLGFSVSTVTKSLAILALAPEIRARIAAREIPATAAYELARVSDPAEQAALVEQLATGRLSRDRLSRVTNGRHRPTTKANSRIGRAVVRLEGEVVLSVSARGLNYDQFLAACEEALKRARKARREKLGFETFLKVAQDQGSVEESSC